MATPAVTSNRTMQPPGRAKTHFKLDAHTKLVQGASAQEYQSQAGRYNTKLHQFRGTTDHDREPHKPQCGQLVTIHPHHLGTSSLVDDTLDALRLQVFECGCVNQ